MVQVRQMVLDHYNTRVPNNLRIYVPCIYPHHRLNQDYCLASAGLTSFHAGLGAVAL